MEERSFRINKQKGILIACEGISASGKSMTIDHLAVFTKKYGLNVKIIEWNSNKVIRSFMKLLDGKGLLTSSIYSSLQWISFLVDYCFKIKPCLNKNYIVVADRYVYTALTRDRANGAGKFMGEIISILVRKPDIILYHDTPAEICLKRIKLRGKTLFHTNKKILSNSLLENKDLYYLHILEKEYKALLTNNKIVQSTNIYYINNDLDEISSIVDMYITEKISQKYNESNVKVGEFIEF